MVNQNDLLTITESDRIQGRSRGWSAKAFDGLVLRSPFAYAAWLSATSTTVGVIAIVTATIDDASASSTGFGNLIINGIEFQAGTQNTDGTPPLLRDLDLSDPQFAGQFHSIEPVIVSALPSAGYAVLPLSATQDEGNTPISKEEAVLFEADTISREVADGPVIAQGNVRAFFGERYLTAERLIYDPATNIVIAEGRVSITDENQETVFAERVELSGDLRDGIAENFTALLQENARIAADTAVREQGARTSLNRVVYTACDVCRENGDPKVPTWRVKSLRVTRDEERKVIRFRHAFLELKGVPVLYTPFIQAPDPSVERQSGFLTPTIGTSSRLSGFVEVPYYFAISNHLDFTFFPKFTLSDGVLWQGEFRRAGRNSFHVWAGGVIDYDKPLIDPLTNNFVAEGFSVSEALEVFTPGGDSVGFVPPPLAADFGNDLTAITEALLINRGNNVILGNTLIGPNPDDIPEDAPGVRWYYFGRGFHNVTNDFRIGYDIERVSDDLFLRRYDVLRRGDLRLEFDRSRTNRLRSNVNFDWRRGNSVLTGDSYLFQGLRASDVSAVTPYVLPILNFRHDFDRRFGGGVVSVNANFASLQRTGGIDSRRMTTEVMWHRDFITRQGHRFNAFAKIRGDGFFFQDLNEGSDNIFTSLVPRAEGTTDIVGRFTPTVGLEWSFPVGRQIGGARLILEPRVQLLASPDERNDGDIINEDSQTTEFDYISLFEPGKSTGYDAVEDGQRLNAGIQGSLSWSNGIKLDAAIGQQFRLQDTDAFSFGTGRGDLFESAIGLGGERSDIVGEANLTVSRNVALTNRLRFDDDFSLRQVDSTLGFRGWRFSGAINYLRLIDNLRTPGVADLFDEDGNLRTSVAAINRPLRDLLAEGGTLDSVTSLDELNLLENVEEITGTGRFDVTDHWSVGATWRQNLRPDFDDETHGKLRRHHPSGLLHRLSRRMFELRCDLPPKLHA